MSLRAAALFTCLAVGVSCSSAQRPAASSAATPQSSTLDLTLPELNGAPVQLKKRRGKVLVLVFFASWARGARVVLPQLEALAKTLDNPEIEFYGIAFDEDRRFVEPFVKELGITFPVLYDRSAHATEELGLQLAPTVLLVDQAGVVRRIHSGLESDTAAQVESQARNLLAKPTSALTPVLQVAPPL